MVLMLRFRITCFKSIFRDYKKNQASSLASCNLNAILNSLNKVFKLTYYFIL